MSGVIERAHVFCGITLAAVAGLLSMSSSAATYEENLCATAVKLCAMAPSLCDSQKENIKDGGYSCQELGINGSSRSSRSSSRNASDEEETGERAAEDRYEAPARTTPPGIRTYVSIANSCINVTNRETSSRIVNVCNFDVEAHWQDPKGGMNSWTIPANGHYNGGNLVEKIWACEKNDSLKRNPDGTAYCIDNWRL